MKQLFVLIVTWACLAGPTSGQDTTPVRVTGQRVNLRAKADLQSEVVGQVGDGDVLSVKSFQDEWVEVVPPESVDLWVYREFVQDNKVAGTKLYVRAGPGINYTVVGMLGRDEKISPRGEFGEWIRIAPPASCSLWVSRAYLEGGAPEKARPPPTPPEAVSPLAPSAAKPAEPPVVTVAPRPVAPVVRAPAEAPATVAAPPRKVSGPVPPADLQLIPLEGQGHSVQREGVLRLAGFVIGRPSRFRLVQYIGSRIETICYVRGNNAQLTELLGQRLLVRGNEYWVRGVRHPVVIPEQIVPRAVP